MAQRSIVIPPHKTRGPPAALRKGADDLQDSDKEVIPPEYGNILMGIIRQLGKGQELSRVALPTFVLEPRSFLERIADFFAHAELLTLAAAGADPLSRFLGVVRYFLSGWHIRPKQIRKPYNPVLGEVFRSRWTLDDGTTAFYVSEQTSHHPPRSSFFYSQPAHHIEIHGELSPRSKFLGNSFATILEGGSFITFPGRHDGEEYELTMPNLYARGILFGTAYMEIGDHVVIKCAKTEFIAEIEFTMKGFFTGTYNGLKGKIKKQSTGEVLYTVGGKWSEQIILTSAAKKATPVVWFDAHAAVVHDKVVAPEEDQDEYESRRLWSKVTEGITKGDLDLATEEKGKIEDTQRANLRMRQAEGVEWIPRFFQQTSGNGLLNIFRGAKK
jgi:hypothetical protein